VARRPSVFSNSVVDPVFNTATYYFEDTAQVIQYHEDEVELGRYGRYDNPTWLDPEEKIARLDGYEAALLFRSGMSAITTSVLSLVSQGERLLFSGNCYRNTYRFFSDILPRYGLESTSILGSTPEEFLISFDENYTPDTRIVFLESPSNPHLYLVDVEAIKKRLHPPTLLIVDPTFASPVNFQPKDSGADLVVHSCTKYLGGHADLIAGSVAGSGELIEIIRDFRNVMGTAIDPNSAFLLNRSLATLTMRMEYLNRTAQALADYLENHPKVSRVFFTGLPSHPHYCLAKKYLKGHGGVISFEVKTSKAGAAEFVDALQIPLIGTNFGSQHSMVEQCSIFTYYHQNEIERQHLGISDTLIRFSLGFEPLPDLIADFENAFTRLG
jgi:cystathionine gamma-synthase